MFRTVKEQLELPRLWVHFSCLQSRNRLCLSTRESMLCADRRNWCWVRSKRRCFYLWTLVSHGWIYTELSRVSTPIFVLGGKGERWIIALSLLLGQWNFNFDAALLAFRVVLELRICRLWRNLSLQRNLEPRQGQLKHAKTSLRKMFIVSLLWSVLLWFVVFSVWYFSCVFLLVGCSCCLFCFHYLMLFAFWRCDGRNQPKHILEKCLNGTKWKRHKSIMFSNVWPSRFLLSLSATKFQTLRHVAAMLVVWIRSFWTILTNCDPFLTHFDPWSCISVCFIAYSFVYVCRGPVGALTWPGIAMTHGNKALWETVFFFFSAVKVVSQEDKFWSFGL